MTSNYKQSNTDLASLLAPLGSGWPQASATGFTVSGTDLNALFAAASSGTASGNIGYQDSGTDIGPRFATLGSTTVQASASSTSLTDSAALGNPSGSGTTTSTTITASKGKGSGYSFSWSITGSGTINGAGSATVSVSSTVNAGTTNSGTLSCVVGDGTTTTTVSGINWSVQNTSTAGNTMVVGSVGSLFPFSSGFGYISPSDGGPIGTMSPTTAVGFTIDQFAVGVISGVDTLRLVAAAPTITSITNISFTDSFGTVRSFNTASATLASSGGGTTDWRWTVSSIFFTTGSTINVTFT